MNCEPKNKPIELELRYAVRDGEIVHISEVSSGILQNCLCPKCRSILIAKKGDLRKHHFAHYNYECCQGAQETALHLLAKEIIYQEKYVHMPVYEVGQSSVKKQFKEVRLEVRELGLIFDAVGVASDENIAIEIKVTHAIDERKRTIVVESGVKMIEIDISAFLVEDYSRDDIVNAVVKSAPRYWINQLQVNTSIQEEENMPNKAKIAGFKLASGYSRKNNCNFESNKIFVLQEIENKSSANYQISACGGYDILQLDISDNPELIKKLSSFNFPVDATLTVETAFNKNKCSPIVTDVNVR